jgi:hypothetical protein
MERSPFDHTADIYLNVPTPIEPTYLQSSTGLEQPTSEKTYKGHYYTMTNVKVTVKGQ